MQICDTKKAGTFCEKLSLLFKSEVLFNIDRFCFAAW